MYYCDCVESSKALGIKIPRNPYTLNGIYKTNEVQTGTSNCCIHCGHHAVYSHIPLNTIGLPDASVSKGYNDFRNQAMLRAFEAGETAQEVAERFDMNIGTVNSIINETSRGIR